MDKMKRVPKTAKGVQDKTKQNISKPNEVSLWVISVRP